MSNSKRKISVVLSEQGAIDLKGILSQWLKINAHGAYVNCKSIDPCGVYFHMIFELNAPDSDPFDFEVQIPQHYIKAILCAKDLTKLGFV